MNRVPLFVLMMAILLSAMSSFSQTNDSSPHPVAPQSGGVASRLDGPDRVIINLLTEEQRDSFRQAVRVQRQPVRELEIKLLEARKELIGVSASPPLDEKAVRAQATVVGNLEIELAVLRAKVLSQIKPPLSAGQIEKIKMLSGGMDLPVRARAMNGPASIKPTERSSPRDENDLPVTKP